MHRASALSLTLALCATLVPRLEAQTTLYTFQGDSTDDWLGYAVAPAGDVNADGLPDLAVGAPRDTLRKLRLFSGADGSFLFGIFGRDPGDFFASSLAPAGDLNGDGHDDLFALGQLAFPDGYVMAVSGANGSTLFDVDVQARSLAAAGDVNGDGLVDVALAPGPGSSNGVRVLSGADGSLIWEATGPFAFGSAVDSVGDINGDGLDDVLAGAYFADGSGGFESGRVFVFSGADGSTLFDVSGDDEYDWLGRSVAGVGDVDGDGTPDFAAMADIEFLFSFKAPYLRAWSGASGTVLYDVVIPATVLSSALDRGLDADGDGFPEILLAYSALSSNETFVLLSGVDGAELTSFPTIFEAGALTGLGDVNGDGELEFAVGDFEIDGNGSNSGEVQVLSLPCSSEPRAYCESAPNSVGAGAEVSSTGSTSLSVNDLVLHVSDCPTGIFGLFFYGPESAEVPFGDGVRCVAAGSSGILRLGPPQTTGGTGSFVRSLDFTQPPFDSGPGAVQAGQTWFFQAWYRDPTGPGGTGFNLSNGLRILFCN